MLFDEIAMVFNQESHRAMARRTGLSRGKVESLQHGCSFVLDAEFLAALGRLGYELRLARRGTGRKMSGNPGRGRDRVKTERGRDAGCRSENIEGRRRAAGGCRYYRPLSEALALGYACHYSLDTGRLRGMRPVDCYRKPNSCYRPWFPDPEVSG